jgi:hypothetical protein
MVICLANPFESAKEKMTEGAALASRLGHEAHEMRKVGWVGRSGVVQMQRPQTDNGAALKVDWAYLANLSAGSCGFEECQRRHARVASCCCGGFVATRSDIHDEWFGRKRMISQSQA